jgi:hypothetical protein
MSRHRKKSPGPRIKIGEYFVAHPVALLKSSAFRSLKLADRKILDRLEIENASHAGKQNGDLICTYTDFQKYGVRKASIADAIKRLVEWGFVEITKQGRPSYADIRNPSHYRLTFLHSYQDGKPVKPTHEWRRFEQQNTGRENEPGARHENEPGKPKLPGSKTRLLAEKPDAETGVLSRSSGRMGGGLRDGCITYPTEQPPSAPREEAQAPPPTFPSGRERSAPHKAP